jgi:hypothetical protein
MRIRVSIERNGKPIQGSATRTASRVRKILLSVLVLGTIAAFAGVGTYSAFTATTTNTGNSFSTGTVVISDNDLDGVMLGLSSAKPSDSDTSCIRVSYTGSLASTVRLYSTRTGSLPQYLNLTITRGTGATAFDNCTGFTPDPVQYVGGEANGVVYNGTLGSFPTAYASGLVDPDASWTNGEQPWYRFVVSVQDNNAAQGLTGTAAFTWEARNT